MKVIIGAGIYGLYAALYLAKRCDDSIVVLEFDSEAFKRATYINQARVHMGYHYPRSLYTAEKSASYFERFVNDYGFSVKKDFRQVYATSNTLSWTNSNEFVNFCARASIDCSKIDPEIFFNKGMCDGAFLTTEYTYDAHILRDYFINEISKYNNVSIAYNVRLRNYTWVDNEVSIDTNVGTFKADFILNATYASTNQVSSFFGMDVFKIKYELCEIILCEVSENLKDVGITVMDGPFFSIMPFGKGGLHSLTSVTFTPHVTSYDRLPCFDCQKVPGVQCTPRQLFNCNECVAKPKSAWPYMKKLAEKYLRKEYGFQYKESLYSIKPILVASEVDDSRPTVIRINDKKPFFMSVLSGKINTVYDMDSELDKVVGYHD